MAGASHASRQRPAQHAQPIWQALLTAALLGSLTLTDPSPPAKGATSPNIILVVTDDQEPNSLARMPYLFSDPGGHWVRFDNAFANFPLCCPSRATILTGLYPHHHGVRANTHGDRFKDSSTLVTWLDGAGYYTALIGKYLNEYPWNRDTYVPPGWDQWQVFRAPQQTYLYYNYQLNENGTWVSYGSQPSDYSTDVLAAKARTMLETAAEPFFLYWGTWAPHKPFTPAPRHQGAYAGLPLDLPANFNESDVSDKPAWVRQLPLMSPSGQQAANNRERSASESLLAVDEAIASMFAILSARGILDNTIVVFTSDNGFSYGSHRWEGKRCVYEECIRVPLLIRYPASASRSVSELVANIDIAPTIADLADVAIPYTPDGRSLVPLLDGTATGWRTSLLLQHEGVSQPGFWAVRTAEWTYSELLTGERELYDLVADPDQLSNVANHPGYADRQAALAAELQRLKGGPAPPPAPTGLTATAGDNQVSLSWIAAPGASSYRVYRRTSGSYGSPLKTGITATTYTDTTALNGQTYFYVVRAFNGAESANSNEVTATPSGGGGGGGPPVSFIASEDAYVKEAYPTTTFNTTVLQIYRAVNSSGTEQWSYLRFDTNIAGTARLRLFVTSGSSGSNFGDAYATANTWSEASLTWGMKPALGAVLDSTHRYAGGWVEWDLGTIPAGSHSFIVANTGSTVRAFASSEATNTANRPQLVITPPVP